jgi:hypothetical protein
MVEMRQRIIVVTLVLSGIVSTGAVGDLKEASLQSNQAEFNSPQAGIVVTIQANVYKYAITNKVNSPIMEFQVAQHATYDHSAPEGWKIDISAGTFRAWTETASMGIHNGQEAEFSMCVSSRGAVLGRGPAMFRLQSGRTVRLTDVWCSAQEPRSHIAIVAGTFIAIVLLHSIVMIIRDRRSGRSGVNV